MDDARITDEVRAERNYCAAIVEALVSPMPGAEDVNITLHAATREIREDVGFEEA